MDMDELRSHEMALHQYGTRSDVEKLKLLLHREFIEIGYSGKTYDYQSVINSLVSASPPNYEIWSQNYEYTRYASNVVQIRYLSAHESVDGTLSRHAKRTSIWVKEAKQWQMKFHQATPAPAFEKLCA